MRGDIGTVLRLYGKAPLAARLHLLTRYLTCPARRIEELVPRTGRILEIGCGHGLFTNMMAVASAGRVLTGIDIDGKKIRIAAGTEGEGRGVTFREIDFLRLEEGPFDSIVVIDVLYLIPYEKQEEILRRCRDLLVDGGLLVIKTMAARPRLKYAVNVLQEFISVRLAGITRGEGLFFRPAGEFKSLLEEIGFEARIVPMHRGYTHPHCCIVCRKGAAGDAGTEKDRGEGR